MILEETDACKVDQNEHNIILFFSYIRLVLGLCSNVHLGSQHHVNEANFNPWVMLLTVKL